MQSVHSLSPGVEYFPAIHATQVDKLLDVSGTCPAEHCEHTNLSAVDTFPEPQRMHANSDQAPDHGFSVPAGHNVQNAEPIALEYFPASQFPHIDVDSEYFPEPQREQELDPISEAIEPGEHI